MIIDLDGIPIKLLRKPIKNLNLRIRQSGDIHVSAPMRLSIDLVYRFLQDRQDWIHRHRQRIQSQSPPTLRLFQNGDILFFLGKAYTLPGHQQHKSMSKYQ